MKVTGTLSRVSRAMQINRVAGLFVCAIASSLLMAQDGILPVDPHADLTDLSRLAHPLIGKTGQTGSYDRTGGNADAIFWYYTRAQPKRAVMADLRGPGCVSRIWVTAFDANTARIEVFIDGSATPAISAWMRDFFGNGALPPFTPPVATPSTGAWISYVPIPYTRSCRIEAVDARPDNLVIYYQVTYREYPDGEPLPGVFQMPPSAAQQSKLTLFSQQWTNRGNDPKPLLPGQQTLTGSPSIGVGQTATLANINGAGVVTGIRLTITPNILDVLSGARIRIRWDGAASYAVNSPLGAFFGSNYAPTAGQALPIGMKNGQLYCYWAMPFSNGAVIELVNSTNTAISSAAFNVTYVPLQAADAGRMRFHTDSHSGAPGGGSPSYRILSATGRGHYLGCVASIKAFSPNWGILEGDEQIYVNGEAVASILGTGTEDYFNGGFYFSGGTVSLPFNGVSYLDNNTLLVSTYRLHVTDPVVFRNGIIVDLEHGGVNEAAGNYDTTAFFYRDDDAGQTPAEPVHAPLPAGSLVNGDFEQGFGGYNAGEANGWFGYQSREYYGVAGSTFSAATDQKLSGTFSQKVIVAGYSGGMPRDAGIAQQVRVTRGSTYQITAHVRIGLTADLFPGDVIGRLGVGLNGDTYLAGNNVVWGESPGTANTWHELSVVVTAPHDYLTVFAGGRRPTVKPWGTATIWIDDVTVEPYFGTPPPPPLPEIINAGFEQDLNSFVWPMWRGPDGNDQGLERIYAPSGNPDGNWLLMVKGLGATGKGSYQYLPTNWQEGRDYRLKVFVRNLGAASIRYSIGYQFGNPGAAGGVGATYGPDILGTTSWQPVTVEFTHVGELGLTVYLRAVNAGSQESAGFDLVTAEQLTFTPPSFPLDRDADGDVDLSDYGPFQACFSGGGFPQNDPQCLFARLDFDDDVDVVDLDLFRACMTGPNVPLVPTCAE